jgi:hypothetical protein
MFITFQLIMQKKSNQPRQRLPKTLTSLTGTKSRQKRKAQSRHDAMILKK